jgi:hypothetical protein
VSSREQKVLASRRRKIISLARTSQLVATLVQVEQQLAGPSGTVAPPTMKQSDLWPIQHWDRRTHAGRAVSLSGVPGRASGRGAR